MQTHVGLELVHLQEGAEEIMDGATYMAGLALHVITAKSRKIKEVEMAN